MIQHVDTSGQAAGYVFDGAGNLLEVSSRSAVQVPSLAQTELGDYRRNETSSITVVGNNLLGAVVRSGHPGIHIANVRQTRTSISFHATIDAAVPLGAAQLHFEAAAGRVTANLNVIPALQFVFEPSYLTVPPDGIARKFGVRIEAPYSQPQTFNLYTLATGVARTQQSTITFLPGQTYVEFGLYGVTTGTTGLALANASMAAPVEALVTVQPGANNRLGYSVPVGLVRGVPWSSAPSNLAHSGAIGIAKGMPWSSAPNNQAHSGSIGIAKGMPWSSAPSNQAHSGAIGIAKGAPWSSAGSNLVVSSQVGISK